MIQGPVSDDQHETGETLASPARKQPRAATATEQSPSVGTLSKGGMGIVYSAYDSDLDRRVALKFVRDDRAQRRDAPSSRRACCARQMRIPGQVIHRFQ